MSEVKLELLVDDATREAMALSLRSIFDVLETSRAARQHVVDNFPDLFSAELGELRLEIRANLGDLVVCETVASPANGTLEILFKPSERYLELVAAVGGHGNFCVDCQPHGWPILPSPASEDASITEASVLESRSCGDAA